MPEESIASKPVSRRSALKWSSAVAAAGIVGIVAGVGGDMLLRPSTTATSTVTNTQPAQTVTATSTLPAQTVTATNTLPAQTVTATNTQTATVTQTGNTVTQTTTATTTKTSTVTSSTSHNVQVLSSVNDVGPFLATIVDGVWTKTDVLTPNQAIGQYAGVSACRSRTYSPDRIRYPMMRVGWVPGTQTTASVANRGTGQFVRITWDQAFSYAASEINRIQTTYGVGSIFLRTGGHQWTANIHTQQWMGKLLASLGGYTSKTGGTSTVGWRDGSPLVWGAATYAQNSPADLLANTKVMIFWSMDPVRTSMTSAPLALQQYAQAGIQFIFIEPRFNETMAMFVTSKYPKNQWIPLYPGTDTALLAAIAYYWMTNNLVNTSFINKYTVGYDSTTLPTGTAAGSSFSDYILGTGPDKTPKTPAWAAAITGVPAATIQSLALIWANNNTYVDCQTAGANRAEYAGEWARMIVSVASLIGKVGGTSGNGIGGIPGDPTAPSITSGARVAPGSAPSIANPCTQLIEHVNFGQAILNGSMKWTTGVTKLAYPATGFSPVVMDWESGGAGSTQVPGTDNSHQAWKSPKLQFILSQNAWWEDVQTYADLVMPVQFSVEHNDITTTGNYTVYMHQLIQPLFQALSDFEIVQGITAKLPNAATLSQTIFQGRDKEGWVQWSYSQGNVPSMTYAQFQAAGYYAYPTSPASTAQTYGGLQNFITDPVKNALTTPSGKIELYSAQIVTAYGVATPNADGTWSGLVYSPTNNTPTAWAVPTYVKHTEDRQSTLFKQYPLLITCGATIFMHHSQYGNMPWLRDEMQSFLGGYRVIWLNSSDAASRGVKYGDLVQVYNNRATGLYAAKVTDRIMPGVIWIPEGGHPKQKNPGTTGVGLATQTTNPTTPPPIEMGGGQNYFEPCWQSETICDGQITHSGLVQVARWSSE
ncbi:MAG: molybdopterin-dependent oxidoreductase [Nitrososphaerales archaeon]